MPRKTRNNKFTLIEILVVLAIAGILLSVSMAGLSRMIGRQGAEGAVRSLSSQLALARSYAVVKNTYVAVLLPDNTCISTYNTPLLQSYLFSKVRLCAVKSVTGMTAQFDSWIDGNEWQSLPSETCASIDVSAAAQVQGLKIETTTGLSSPAVIFKPSGTIVGDGTNPACISVIMGKYINGATPVYETKSGAKNGWDIKMNPFTGKSSYEKKTND